MKNIFLHFLIGLSLITTRVHAEEKLLYSTDFQDWDASSFSTEVVTVSKMTNFSREQCNVSFWQVSVVPAGSNPSKFDAIGYLQTNKVAAGTASPYVELSPLHSISRIEVSQAATGGGRGISIWKKSKTDADWVPLHNQSIVTARGETLSIVIGDGTEEEVALKFTSFNVTQNAHLTELKIYGDYTSTVEQVTLTAEPSLVGGGQVTLTPSAESYDINTEVQIAFTPAFGYRFKQWVDEQGSPLSATSSFSLTLTHNRNVVAQVEATTTYAFDLAIEGSRWGKVELSPEPVAGRYEAGTIVSMTVVPREVCTFQYWDDRSSEPTRRIEMTSDVRLSAIFDERPFIVGWNFADQNTKQSKSSDFYSDSENQGIISLYKPDGVKVNWLSNAGSFSPSLPCARMWTPAANFDDERRYFEAAFSTKGYSNVEVRSLVSGNYQLYTVIKMQYSLDGLVYHDLRTVDITPNYNATWAPCIAVLPQEACDVSQVRIRWMGDATSPKLGTTAENDGTALTNIYVFAQPIVVDDADAPQLVAQVPAQDSHTASASGNIVLTFNEKVKMGAGDVILNGVTLTPTAGSKSVSYAYSKLAYNTAYSLTIPHGAITDLAGNSFAGVTFMFSTMSRPKPIAKLFDCVVAADGTADYTSVQAAVDAAPMGCVAPYLIYIKEGRYTGHVDIPASKPFLHFIGQDKERVIITDSRLCGGDNAYNVSQGATVVVNAKDFYAENISFENSWGVDRKEGPQALALYTVTDRATLKNCKLRSFQDTYLSPYNTIADRVYLEDCFIEGAVDYIYGGGNVFFEGCTLYNLRAGGYIVAPSHKEGTAWGYVFNNCVVDGVKEADGTIWLGRPWQNAPLTVFLNTRLDIAIKPEAWYPTMGAIPVIFADYATIDATGNPVDRSQRNDYYWYTDAGNKIEGHSKASLADAEAATYTREAVLSGADGWNPMRMTEPIDAPTRVDLTGSHLTWEASEYAICYVVSMDDAVVGFTKEANFTLTAPAPNAVYSVQAVSEFGSLSTPTQANQGTSIQQPSLPSSIRVVAHEQGIFIDGLTAPSLIRCYSVDGRELYALTSTNARMHIPMHGMCIVRIIESGVAHSYKVVVR